MTALSYDCPDSLGKRQHAPPAITSFSFLKNVVTMTHVNLAVRFYISNSRNVLHWRRRAMKGYEGVEIQLHGFFKLGSRWRWAVSFTSRPLYPRRKILRYPLNKKLAGPQSRSGRFIDVKTLFSLPRIRTTIPRLPTAPRRNYTDYAIPAPKYGQKYDTPPPEQLTTIPRRLSKITAVTLVECRFNTLGIIFIKDSLLYIIVNKYFVLIQNVD
jgi:hypothetical protein